jgi:hypothetical protein
MANLKFINLSTTTSRVSVRNINESEREWKTNRGQIKSETRWFVLPRFGSCKPTPRWGGHKDRVSFNPFPLSNGHLDRVSFSSQSNGTQSSRKDHYTIGVSCLNYNWVWSQERMRKKRSNPSARAQMNTNVTLSSHYLIWTWERIWSLWLCLELNAIALVMCWRWKTWILLNVGWLGYL